jgi:phage-related tail protein
MAWFEIHIHQTVDTNEVEKKLNRIIKQNTDLMATVAQLNEKVDLLQTTIDETQAAALEKITTLETTVQELRDQIANGGSTEELQAIADKLDAATADLKSTFPTAPPVDPEA